MEIDLLVLRFVKANRSADFQFYLESFQLPLPWIFTLDHTYYARNLPVHLQSMYALKQLHPKFMIVCNADLLVTK